MSSDGLDGVGVVPQAELLAFNLAGYPVAILAAQSAGLVQDAMAVAEADRRRVWLLQLLQCTEQPGLRGRHSLLLKGAAGVFPLAIDEVPVLETISCTQLRPLPDIMAKVERLAAVRGFWVHGGGLRLLFDPLRLPDYPVCS